MEAIELYKDETAKVEEQSSAHEKVLMRFQLKKICGTLRITEKYTYKLYNAF